MIYLLSTVRGILVIQDTVILMLSARNILGKLREEELFRVTRSKLWNMLPIPILRENEAYGKTLLVNNVLLARFSSL